MRKDKLFLIGVTGVSGAFALFVRWLQNLSIFDAGTGLAKPGAVISWILVLLCIAAAAVQFLLILRSYNRPCAAVQVLSANGVNVLIRIITFALAVLSLIGAALMLLSVSSTLMLCL